MSKLRTPQGDDHPDAAIKHLLDARALLGHKRADGAAYLSGYVVECALKSLWQLETGEPRRGHDIVTLAQAVSAVATVSHVRTARYFKVATGVASSAISKWTPGMRYRPAGMPSDVAQVWCKIAEDVYLGSVAQMRLDGVV